MTGFLNIYKPSGKSSAAVVGRVKWLLRTPCGHMGTLDPLAEGVLPVGVGNATRLFDHFLSKKKRYTARFRFGATTDTLDAEGEVTAGGRIPSAEEVAGALPAFLGEIEQIPPRYSAVSVGGRRGYELARKGVEFEIAPKKVVIDEFRLAEQTAPDEYEFTIVCGGGTYVRALVRDLAAALGTQGYMTYLRRDASGVFTAETAVPLEALTPENVRGYLIPTETVLPFPVLDCADERIFHGVTVPVAAEDGVYKLYRGGEFYGLARAEGGFARAEKKLC